MDHYNRYKIETALHTIIAVLLVSTAFHYGATYSLTMETYFVQGYLGAAVPALLTIVGIFIGFVQGTVYSTEQPWLEWHDDTHND